MARMNGKSRFPIDAALILRDAGLAAVTVDTDLPVQKLAQVGAVWQNPPDPRDGVVYVVGHVESLTGTSPTLSLDIYSAEDANKTNAKLQKSIPLAAGEWFEEPTDQFSMLRNHPAATYWYATLNVGGTTPAAGVFVYLAPDFDA